MNARDFAYRFGGPSTVANLAGVTIFEKCAAPLPRAALYSTEPTTRRLRLVACGETTLVTGGGNLSLGFNVGPLVIGTPPFAPDANRAWLLDVSLITRVTGRQGYLSAQANIRKAQIGSGVEASALGALGPLDLSPRLDVAAWANWVVASPNNSVTIEYFEITID